MTRWAGACLLVLVAVGCDDGEDPPLPRFTTDGAPPAARQDGGPDAVPVQDGAVDARPADAAPDQDRPMDGEVPLDQGVPDLEPPDGAVPDLAPLDMARPDMAPPDMAPPDMAPPAGPCPDDMVLVDEGAFPYGPDNVRVDTAAYCIHRLEVTAGAFNACADAGGCAGYDQWARCVEGHPDRPNQCNAERQAWPANWIDWFRAEEYCRWIGGRLPSEYEWEKAARGFAGRPFPHGFELTCGDAHFARGPVYAMCSGFDGLPDALVRPGSYPNALSSFGVLDMAGNVEEWVDIREDPMRVPADDEYGVTRGGSYTEAPEAMATWAKDTLLGHGRTTAGHGFRCVMDPR